MTLSFPADLPLDLLPPLGAGVVVSPLPPHSPSESSSSSSSESMVFLFFVGFWVFLVVFFAVDFFSFFAVGCDEKVTGVLA